MRRDGKEPLFRRQNKLATNYRGDTGGEFRHERNSKQMKEFEGSRMPMRGKNRGVDYTPLFRFLQSSEGRLFDEVHSESVSRLDTAEPIFWLVVDDGSAIVRVSEATYYHAMCVDDEGILRFVDKSATMEPYCTCCTTTLDGKPLKPRSV